MLLQYLRVMFNFSFISSQSFGLRSHLWLFFVTGPKEAAYLWQVLLDMFCPLQQHSDRMQTAAVVWPVCQLKTNPLCWARHSAIVGRQHSSQIGFSVATDINNNVVNFYFHVWSLSRLLWCFGSGTNIAVA